MMGLPRRLDLDAEVVRARFQEMSQSLHPDRGGAATGFQGLVDAAATLASPARRWRHWAELEGWQPREKIVAMEESVADDFARVGDLLQRARSLAAAKSEANSALARAMAERKSMAMLQEITCLLAHLRSRESAILEQANAGISAEEAGRLSGHLSCFGRWQDELRSAVSALA